MTSWQGKTIFMTGGSRGIGRAIALKMAAQGANIVIAAKTDNPHPRLPGTVHSVAEEVRAAGGRCLPLVVDARDEAQLVNAVAEAVEFFGGIDVLINNVIRERNFFESFSPCDDDFTSSKNARRNFFHILSWFEFYFDG